MEVQSGKIEVPDWSIGPLCITLPEDLAIFDSAAGGRWVFARRSAVGHCVATALSQRTTGRSERAPLLSFVS